MVTIYRLNKLTTNQLDTLRKTIASTKGSRCKAVAFASLLPIFANNTVENPKVGSRIARVYSYNFGTKQRSDYRAVIITCGRFVEWGKDRNSVVTTEHSGGVFTGLFLSLSDAAMQQLTDEFGTYIM